MIARAFPTTIFPWIQIGFKEKWCGDMPLVYFQFGDTLLVCIETCQRHIATLWCNVASVEKYRSPRRKINPVGTWYFTSAHNIILNIEYQSFDAVIYQENILSSWVFRRETASGFYPWGNVEGPRKRVAEGLCGWRHGNSFPMSQSAQSYAKWEAFHIAPRLFFMFLFLITFTIRQHCIIYPQEFSTEPKHAKGISLRYDGLKKVTKKIPDITIRDCLTN